MSSTIEEIRARMNRYPEAEIAFDETSITYYPGSLDGFVVRLVVRVRQEGERYRVYYGGSCQEEENRSASIITFGFGLSNG